jgi:hypothetical protein
VGGAGRLGSVGLAGRPRRVTMGGQGKEGVDRSVVLRWCWRRWEPASVVAPGEGTALPLMVLITMVRQVVMTAG